MRKALIIISAVLIALVLQGCYTVISAKKFSRKTWLKYHKHEFFYKTRWGREWNYYYYDPMLTSRRTASKKHRHANVHEHEIDVEESEAPHHHCRAYTDCCLMSCLFPNYFCLREECDNCDEETQQEDSTRSLPPQKPPKRRGM